MSELLDSFVAQLPETCQNCPVLLSALEAAKSSERCAVAICESLGQTPEDGPFRNPEANDLWFDINSEMLDISTDGELRSTYAVEVLAKAGRECPGTKRGAPPSAPASWKLEAYLLGKRVCRNPHLGQTLKK